MAVTRGRTTALIAALCCLGVLILATRFKDRAYEAWYLYQVETGDARAVKRFGTRLEQIAGTHTVRGLLGLLERRKSLILDGENDVSRAFFRCVKRVGPEGIARVILALDEEERVRARKLFLRTISISGALGRSALVACLRHPQPVVRREIIEMLDRVPDDVWDEDATALLGLRQDSAKEVRRAVAFILAPRFPRDVVFRRELREALKDGDVRIRLKAATALANLGWGYARLAEPELIQALQDPENEVRRQAANALDHLKLAIAAERDGTDRGAKAPQAAAAVPALIRSLQSWKPRFNDDPYAADEAYTLAAIGRPAVRALAGLLGSEDVVLRSVAAGTLAKIGADARAAIPALEQALSDEDEEVRREAAKALAKIRGAPAPVAAPAAASAPAEGRP